MPLDQKKAFLRVFGKGLASFGCVEEQARGSLHFHVVYWGELTANLLQSAATYAVLLGAVAKALDGMVKAEVDSVQVEHLINNFEGIVPHKPAISNAHNPTRYPEQFYQDSQQTVIVCNSHSHN